MMSDTTTYTYPSPLTGYEDAPPLPEEKAADKSLISPPAEKSKAYERFVDPLDKTERGAFDVHVYHVQKNPKQARYARELWERIRRECKETLPLYALWLINMRAIRQVY